MGDVLTMAEYIKLSEQEKAVLTKQEEEKQYWFNWLKQFRATKEYPIKETAVDNFLRGYGEAVQHMLSVNEQLLLKSADVVEVVHSNWIKRNNERRCPICDFFYLTNGTTVYNLCPMCGAKMDGERKCKE